VVFNVQHSGLIPDGVLEAEQELKLHLHSTLSNDTAFGGQMGRSLTIGCVHNMTDSLDIQGMCNFSVIRSSVQN
jgi:hypothetical protein